MKILLGGTTGHLTFNITRLAISLQKEGLDVSVASTSIEEQKGLISDLQNSNIKWFNIPRVNGRNMFGIKIFSIIRHLIQRENFEIIHLNSFHHFLWFYTAKLFTSVNSKLITTIHTTLHGSRFENFSLILESILINKIADKVFTVAQETKAKLISVGATSKKITNIPNGIDIDYFDRITSSQQFKRSLPQKPDITLLTVGGLIQRKGHKYLFHALKEILSSYDHIKLLVVGDGPEKQELRKLIEKLELQKDVILLGRIDRYEDLYCLLKAVDIFVFPSLAELFPFAVIEAMVAGKPIVATNVGGIPEAIENSLSGILVSPGKSRELAEGIKFLLKNPSEADKMGQAARKRVEKMYDLKKIARQTIDTYKKILHH